MCAADHAVPSLTIHLFGPFQARVNGAPLPRPRTRKGQWVLALLALRHGRDIERSWLAGTLWPDSDEAHAHRSLRVALTDLRHALGAEARHILAPTSSTLRLDTAGTLADVVAFDTAIAEGDEAALERAIGLYRGPLLEGCLEEWAMQEREAREQAYLAALETLAAGARARADHAGAARFLQRAVAVDPLREPTQQALMEALADSGDTAAAILVYREFRLLLHRELNAEPSAETRSLVERLRSHARHRLTSSTFKVQGSKSSHPTLNLEPSDLEPARRGAACRIPRPLSPFVGRERELNEIAGLLASAPLVTLAGTGGIGKTRLAIRVTEESVEEYADGVWFVDLAALSDPALVPQAVARVLQVREQPECALTQTLQEALSFRQLLLVLDNCEHLLDACAHLAEDLLSHCAGLRILATSRQALGLPGEILWRVPPLSLPEPGVQVFRSSGVQADNTTSPPEHLNTRTPEHPLLESEAVRLFVARAAAASAGFGLGESNAAAAVQICRRLDGIPLAIELAAARLNVLSVEQIAARLDDRFRLLTGGTRTALPRQQTLRATMDWSYDLLSEPERVLLRRLSVFTGGWTLEAAEEVCSADGYRGQGSGVRGTDAPSDTLTPDPCTLYPDEVLDLLGQLIDRSLVGVEEHDGAKRYGLLETTREYAREWLREAGEADAMRARHARFFLTLAERLGPELRGGAQTEALHRLEEEHDNCRAALDTFLAQEAVEAGLRLGGALGWFWWMRGYLTEGRERLQALLALADRGVGHGASGLGPDDRENPLPECSHPAAQTSAAGIECTTSQARGPGPNAQLPTPLQRAQAMALFTAGMLADDLGDYEAARRLFQESLALSREIGDPPGAAMALNCLGGLARHARDYPTARTLYEESLAIWREVGDPWGAATALTSLGRVALQEGESDAAHALVNSALKIQRQLGDPRAIARSLTTLGTIAARRGDYARAHVLHEESLAIGREIGARGAVEETLRELGNVARERGDDEAARACHEERLTIAREMGSVWAIAESLYALGLLARDRGEDSRARTLWSESLAIFRRLGDKREIAERLEGIASMATPPVSRHAGPGEGVSRGSHTVGHGPARAQRAARLFGAADALRELVGAPIAARHRAEYERQIAAARALLDAAAFDAAWEEGRTGPLEEVIRVALAEEETGPIPLSEMRPRSVTGRALEHQDAGSANPDADTPPGALI